jgi:branched-chain amino acid transport system ATP-binding protein
MLMSVKDISVCYDNVQAVHRVSIEVEDGGIVCLIGSNGAGKTTVLRAISGLQHLASGQIWFSNKRIDKLSPENIMKLGIGHVLEGRRVFPYLTVLENIQMGSFIRNDRRGIREDIEKIYKLFPRLKERIKQPAGTLSGGEQQMLAIARAMMARPKLLLMDEPSLGLAPIIVAEVGQIIKQINKEGTTIILVEQNAHMALSIAQTGYVMETGNVVLHNVAKDLAQNDLVKKIYLGG